MRLLRLEDDGSFSLVEYLGSDAIPAYAILSHTWGSDQEEVNFKDLTESVQTLARAKAGYQKLTFCASQAARDGLRYCWADTCCINKADAAELQEAINSMFRWYRSATRCYVYLSDVSNDPSTNDDRSQRWKPALRQSRWFTRGWTLQELVAPTTVDFFSKEGTLLGNKGSLEQTIQEITGVAAQAIRGESLSQFSEKEILSWVENRQTKRDEDIVYCLLGFFDVFMPLIYGEGRQNALDRLREQVQKKSSNCKQPLHDEHKQALLDSLRFEQIDARHLTIKNAHARTCKWLLRCPEYLEWLDPTKLDNHHGFLWIKGKPGTGKSTLMKFAIAQTRRKTTECEVISFFFNARGENLERSTIGTYRSLLLQLLEKFPRLLCVFDSLGLSSTRISMEHEWGIGALETLLEQAFKMLERPTICYIDALDECNEQQIREMVAFFERIGELVASSEIPLQICFSSRHYPHITIQKGIELVLEGQEGHDQDITNYIENELKIGKSKLAQQIYTEVQKKASGIFMWVVLVVGILNKEHDRGRIHALRRRLQEIPGDLHTLFRDILTRDSHNRQELLLCIQWVLFAKTPLTPVELYYAILSGVEPEELSEWDQIELTPDAIERFILDSSKGLTDITTSKVQRVQFIHESVRDFLLKGNNLSNIWPELANNFQGTSHETLKQCCLNFMKLDISVPPSGTESVDNQPGSLTGERDTQRAAKRTEKQAAEGLIKSVVEKYPFLAYSVQNVLYHADTAEGYGITQEHLKGFPIDRWVEFNNLLEKHGIRKYTNNVSLLYLLAERNLKNLIKASLSALDCLEVGTERYGPPLFASVACGSIDTTQIFFEAVKDHPTSANRFIQSPISTNNIHNDQTINRAFIFSRKSDLVRNAVDLGNTGLLAVILDSDFYPVDLADHNGRTPLWYASKSGRTHLVGLLLATNKVRVDGDPALGHHTPLLVAIQNGHEKVAELLLLTQKTSLDRRDRSDVSPLSEAVERNMETVVRLLLDADADDDTNVDQKAADCANVLISAARCGNDRIVEQLLDAGTPINPSRGTLRRETASYAAVEREYVQVGERLLQTGADVNAVDAEGKSGTALEQAIIHGHKEVVKLLLSAGADVNAERGFDSTVLQKASSNGQIEIVELLLSAGAEVNVEGAFGTALQEASGFGHEEVVKLLLSAGAEVNAEGEFGTALQEASGFGHEEVVKLLLSAGAEVNAEGAFGTALQQASRSGRKEVVKLLLGAGAEVNAESELGTALQQASGLGHKEVVRLLKDAGAVEFPNTCHP